MDGVHHYNPHKIVNEFGPFYSNLGLDLVKQIKPGKKSINDYIGNILRTLNSMAHHTTPIEVEKIIRSLPNKTSYRHGSK